MVPTPIPTPDPAGAACRPAALYVAAHKPCALPDAPGYRPMQVGRALGPEPLGLPGDDTGDNISALNPYFCELTLLYWMWKNATDDVLGLVHYRRYFAPRARALVFAGAAGSGQPIAAADDFAEIGPTHDLLLAEPVRFQLQPIGLPISNEQQYSACVVGLDLPILRGVIAETTPDYLDCYDYVMRDNACSLYNMLVGRKAAVDAYAEWLFPLLFLLETRIPYRSYPPYQARVFGFLAERLLTVWAARNRMRFRIGYRPVVMVE